jgi:hypothetical protein
MGRIFIGDNNEDDDSDENDTKLKQITINNTLQHNTYNHLRIRVVESSNFQKNLIYSNSDTNNMLEIHKNITHMYNTINMTNRESKWF